MKILAILLTTLMFNQPVIVDSDGTPTDAEETITASIDNIEYITPGIIIEGYPATGIVIPFKQVSDYDENQPHLTKQGGVFYGESGKETYYNLPMGRVINYMRELGYTTEEYPYWVRSDGVKMLGNYVMVAADFSIRPRGTLVKTSLGTGIVVDTGSFAKYNSTMLDIAVTW